MFKRQKQPETPKKQKRKLTAAEKREIRRIMEQARGDGRPHSAQDTLPFRQIYPDGLCKLDDTTWSRCIEFEDVNYQLAQPDDQTAIFEALCDMYNAHDSSIGMEITLPCHHMNREDFVKRIEIAAQGDDFDDLRELYTQMLRRQLEQGNNGLVKSKLLILTLDANDIHSARAKFSRIILDTLNHFKTMGALAKALDGREWLELLHGILHPDGERFSFDWDWLAPSGLHVKDFIAPSSFRFGAARRFQMGTKCCAASFLQITAPEMDDRILAELLDTDSDLLLSIHVRSMDQNEAIKTVKRKITDIDSMKIDAQKRAAREGFDMDIIPTDIATYAGEAKNILRDLQSRNERMFLVTFLLVNMADSKRKLDNDISRASSVAQKYNCQLTRLDFQQEQGFVSALPLGVNQIKIQRGLTTSALAIMMPFTTQEIFQDGDALYYGLNATSGNMILADRKQNKTPNGLILGTPGSGKSFSAKRSILNVFLITCDDIIICDPEAEYFPLVHRLHGQVIKISPTSRHHVNPMDINLNYSEDDNPLALKSDFILSFCELAAGGRNGLEPVEKTLIDRAVRSVYRPYIADPKPENMPILEDLYDEIKRQPEPEAQRVAAALELYVHGSLNVFNHRTNVDINNRLVCFDIKELGKQLKNLGMLVIQDQVWNRVSQNRDIGKSTWYFVDEFHLLLRGEVGAWSVEIWKRFRKWGGIPTGITQNIKDLLASPEIENIFENSDFIYLLNQASGDRRILCERLNISSKQAGHISNSAPGEGLIVFGNVILPFKDDFSRDNELYDIMTTKPGEVANLKIEQEG